MKKSVRISLTAALSGILLLCLSLAFAQTRIGGGAGRQTWGPGQGAVLSLPQTVNFPSTIQGQTSATQTVTLNNLGTIPANVTAITIPGGPNPGDYATVAGGSCTIPFLIAAGSSCTVNLQFSPTALGTRSAILVITSDALINATTQLVGTGLQASPGQSDSTLTPNTVTFPDTLVDATSAAQDMTLASTGNATLNVSDASLSGADAADFALTSDFGATPFSLAAGLSGLFHITCTPSRTGVEQAQLNVTSDGLSSPNVTLLSCKGIAPASSLTSSLSFGSINTGTTSAAQTATFTNTGSTTLSIANIALAGTDPGDYVIQSQDCGTLPVSLIAGNACHINVACAPTVAGSRPATLQVTDVDTGTHSTTLSCTGVTPPPSLAITTTALANCTQNQSCDDVAQATGGVPPYQWTLGGTIPVGAEDILDYMVPPLPDRDSFCMTGTAVKCTVVQNGIVWWDKSLTVGGPWDGEGIDGNWVYQWFTEGPTFTNLSGYKKYKTPVALWPRYHVPGNDDVHVNPGPNLYDTTESCGSDNLAAIDNQDVKGELTGPFTDVNFGGSIPDATPYLLATKYIKGVGGIYQNREQYWLVKGFGQVKWQAAHLSGGVYVIDSTSTNTTKTANVPPTPNFACGVPDFPALTKLPADSITTSRGPWMQLKDSTGHITGSAITAGTTNFTLQVEDSVETMAQKALSLTISAQQTSNADNRYANIDESCTYPDGPTDDIATKPTTCNRTDLAHTPSPNTPKTIAAGDATAFQSALNNAVCGDVIVLAAGSTYSGSFTTPALNCDVNHWLTIRTSRLDLIPAEGNRALPCDANVQLSNRPAAPYGPGNCGSRLRAGMAKIKSAGAFEEAIRIPPHSHYIRFIGLEIEGKTIARTAQVQNIINMQATTGSDHFIFDRCWIHGIADRSYVRAAFMQDGVSNVSLIDSSVTDIHCLTGVCTDSQIFQGGLGNSTKKGFKGVNNYVESAGTNSMSFGGGGATVMATDFEWRRNYQYLPMIWNNACASALPSCVLPDGTPVTYDGLGPYSVKNIWEIKDVIRALVEGNVLENTWEHADQAAFGFLLTPKNQNNGCPSCIENDVTIRYNHERTAGGFLQAVNTSSDAGGLATEGNTYVVHDNVAENLWYNGVTNTGFNKAAHGFELWSLVSMACANSFVLNHVHVFHNTVLTTSGRNYNAGIQLDGPLGACSAGMELRDNIFNAGTNNGGINQTSNTACAGDSNQTPASKFTNCWTAPFVMTKNAIIGGSKTWPAGNFFPANGSSVGFVNYNGANGGDYRLCAGAGNPDPACLFASGFHNAGTDGKDLGADVVRMKTETAGVSPWN